MFNKLTNFLNRIKGQSFFEVIVAVGLISIVLISLVSVASLSIKASSFSRNQTEAARYTQQASEWLIGEKDASWSAFSTHAATPAWCLDSLYWGKPNSCSASDIISGTVFTRSVNFTTNADGSIQADIQTSWKDAQGTHNSQTSQIYTNWSDVALQVIVATTAPTPIPTPTITPTPVPTPTPIPAPIASWKFDDGSGTNVSDSVGNFDATWQGTLGNQWTTGISGGAGNFNGTDNYVSRGSITPYNSSRSVSFWFYSGSTGVQRGLVSVGNSPFDGTPLWLMLQKSNNVLSVYHGGGYRDGSTVLSPNTWYLATYTYNGSTHALTLYLNTTSQVNTTIADANYNNTNLYIGAGYNAYFSGRIDNLKIFNYPLTLSQIQYLYNNP